MADSVHWKWWGALLLAAALALALAVPAVARTPATCQLLTKSLAQDYFNTDMTKTAGVRERCEWGSRINDLHRSASLMLVTWRNPSNARGFFKLGCRASGTTHPKKLKLTGADEACVSSGFTGLCFDQPTGRVCLWGVIIDFRRGNATGELDTVAPKPYSLNSISHAARLARKVLARWH